jgi:hypothetical protein
MALGVAPLSKEAIVRQRKTGGDNVPYIDVRITYDARKQLLRFVLMPIFIHEVSAHRFSRWIHDLPFLESVFRNGGSACWTTLGAMMFGKFVT